MSCFKMTLVAVAALTITAVSSLSAAANSLVNPGFEDPITMDGPPFVGSWEGFAGGSASSANSTAMPRTGAQSLDLSVTGANTFAGAFQDVGVVGGVPYIFSGWHKLLDGNSGGTEVRIEWRDATSEVGRTPNLVAATTAAYTQFSLQATAPANATIARAVYAIQSFGASAPQNVLVDDVSFTAVPEPAALCLAGLAGVAIFALRRRSK